MKAKKLLCLSFLLIILLSTLQGCSPGLKESGIEDIDLIRSEISTIPTTKENAKSRHAALTRWWRLLWRQGYDMSAFDSTAYILLRNRDYPPETLDAITNGYKILEALYTNPVYIKEIKGKSPTDNETSQANTKTDWPYYHGIDGAQTGYSPDAGPSEGKLAWRFPKPYKYDVSPVLSHGKVYLSSPGIDVIGYSLDELSGKIEWRARQYGTGFYTTPKTRYGPIITDERMIIRVGGGKRNTHIIDKKTGKRITGAEIDNTDDSEQVVYGGRGVYFTLAKANTMEQIRMYQTQEALVGDPVLIDGSIYATCEKGILYAFNTESPDPVWKVKLGAELRGAPEIAEGSLYVGSKDGRLFALDAAVGTVLWTHQQEVVKGNAYQYYSLPAESNGRLYIGTAGSELLCLDVESGKLLWKHQTGDWIRSRPLVLADIIYVATLGGEVLALKDNGNSAELIKTVQLGEQGFIADLVGNENGILAAGRDMILYSLSPKKLRLNWKHGILDGVWIEDKFYRAGWTGGLQPSPTIVEGILYIGGSDGFVHALDAESGSEIWRFETGGRLGAAITVAEGKVFFGEITGEGNYYALDKNTGEVIWQTEEFGNVWVGASYTNNGLFFGNMEGVMFGVNPRDGSVNWTYDTAKDTHKENWREMDKRGHGWPPGIYPVPVADATKVYIGSWSGYYFAFDQKTGEMVWRTQTNGGNLNGGLPDSSAPVLWGEYIYVQKIGHVLAALSTVDGSLDWEWHAPPFYLQNGTVAAQNNKIFASYGDKFTALPYNCTVIAFDDVENGSEELWRYKGGGGLTAPVSTEGKLITGSTADPFVVCLDPEDGSVIWRFFSGGEMLENVPAIYGNKVYAHFNTGWLYAIQ